MVRGITAANLGEPDHELALRQHREYTEALAALGLEMKVLEPDSRFPDSTFVEDVALFTSRVAVVTLPGAMSRRGEEKEMACVLRSFYDHVESIRLPGTLDAGDVMMAGDHYYIGLSDRTNPEGARQLISVLEKYGMTGETVEVQGLLHLKSGASFLEDDLLLVAGELAGHPAFAKFRKIRVPPEESYAANSLWVNGTVLVPAGFPRTRELIEKAGLKTLPLDVSEFRKLDGGLSCLSLRF